MTERDFSRQEAIVPGETLQSNKISVIGCGAVGRQVALSLAAIGSNNIQLIDFDHVEETNITTQGYLRDQLGQSKVDALSSSLCQIDADITIETINDRWRPKYDTGDIVFCCVDSITTRGKIWQYLKDKVGLFIDGRMLGEVMEIYSALKDDEKYDDSLFEQEEAFTGSCTAQSTIYTASICANYMVHQMTRHLRNIPVDPVVRLNLLASEISVED